jgi:hypothetical protein
MSENLAQDVIFSLGSTKSSGVSFKFKVDKGSEPCV